LPAQNPTPDAYSIIRLGEFLLPGTSQARMVFAHRMDLDDQRLRLVDLEATEQRVA